MNSLFLEAPERLAWRPVEAPTAGPGEALVRVLRCGVCGTDLHAFRGRQPFFSYPRRLGHEAAVEILSAPEGSGLRPGDRCAVEPYLFCGACPACTAGKTNCCRNLRVLGVHVDGAHAEHITVPADKLHPSSTLSSDALALVEPLVIGAHAVERSAAAPGEPFVIIGLGPIGLAAALVAQSRGLAPVGVDLDANRRRFAEEHAGLGATLAGGEGLEERLRDHFGRLPAVLIDATGNRASMNGCFTLAEHGGRITFVGLFTGDLTIDDPNFHRRELTLSASRAGLPRHFREVIALMESGALDARPLITHRFPFAEAAAEFPRLEGLPGLLKAMIDYE